MFDLHGCVAVVTGGSAGIGRGMAIALARQGADLAIIARRPDKVAATAKEIESLGVRCLPIACDVTSEESVIAARETVLKEYGHIEILINNAGTGGPPVPTVEMEQAHFEKLVNLDLNAAFRTLRIFAKPMIEAGYGRVINIGSAMGLRGNMDIPLAGYHAAKGGVINLTRGVASEWAKQGVTCNCICPGTFPSESNDEEFIKSQAEFVRVTIPMGRPAIPTDIDRVGEMDAAICFLASREASYVTGVILPVDGGWTAI
ncbi:MAG: SDR family oxidoreductase [Lachnospiraceae bacterium]|nr:SDR family oxidoreductase [Lachnospiraceae bacterium]